jgi:aminopeptidase N
MKRLSLFLALLLTWPFAQAQTAGENIDVTHYAIYVNELNFTNHTLQGETFVDFTATANVQQIVLELKSLVVTSVTATGASVANFSQDGDFLFINLASPMAIGASATLDIVYGGSTFSETWGGVEWWGADYVYNLGVGFDSQPHNLGKTWFPCVDNFTDKATYNVFVTTTNDKKAICGGELVATVDNGDGTSTWHWITPQEIAAYHISFAVGNYEVWEDGYDGIEHYIPITVYAKPNQMNNVPGTFVHIKEIISFFEENLGPYPFNRIGYVSTGKGCMEHTDNIALAASIIDGQTTGEEYIAHELSHMWSGNLVTCADAGDMWLNEGFAQFWGAFYEVGIYGNEHFQNTISAMVNSINSWCNNENNWIPLNNMPLNMTYDGTAIYDRGAVIVNTMMNYMGRENFLSAMRQYFQQYAYQTATSEQLCEALSQYSGIDMHGFFDTYVYSSGMPHLYAVIKSVEQDGDLYDVTIELRYQHIGDTHIGQGNAYYITFIGPDFQLATERVDWDGLSDHMTITLDFEPVGMVNDFDNNWLDGKTQKNFMLTSSSQQSFGSFKVEAVNFTDSVFVAVENHLVGPYDDPLIPYLNLSSKHFWTISRYDFGEAEVKGVFDYSTSSDGDILQSENDSATLLYRRDASEAWHKIAYTVFAGSTWKHGRLIVDNLLSGEYTFAAWDKEALGEEKHYMPKQRMQVYPNPAEGIINISWGEATDGQIRIVGSDGKELESVSFSHTDNICLLNNGLPKGCFTVLRLNNEGKVLNIEKLIIKE